MNKTLQTDYRLRTYKYPPDYDPAFNEIGGWLILVIIGRILTIYDVFNLPSLLPYFGYETILDIYIIITACFALIGELALSVFIIAFIFLRKIMFRKLYIIQCSLQIIFLLFTLFFFSVFRSDISWNIWVFAIGFGIILIPYLFLSKRVKNTYIYPDLFLPYDGMYGYAAKHPSKPLYTAGASDKAPEKSDAAPQVSTAGPAAQASKKADSTPNVSTNPAAQVPYETETAPEISFEPPAKGTYHIKDIQVPDSDLLQCPACNTMQHNKRRSCCQCGARFIQ
jgi:hypothetical protein